MVNKKIDKKPKAKPKPQKKSPEEKTRQTRDDFIRGLTFGQALIMKRVDRGELKLTPQALTNILLNEIVLRLDEISRKLDGKS